ncbi:MAG: hypothetical protein ACRDK4_14680 [Solirubrobacteraceae bacterium]
MIDRPALIAWRSKAPWPDRVQIEQYLLLSRLMIEIARNEVLGQELAMRGGTCIHKLQLPSALRYSEDLDYVRSTHTGIKPYTTIFGHADTTWTQQATLSTGAAPTMFDNFGHALALSADGKTALVGDPNASRSAAAPFQIIG